MTRPLSIIAFCALFITACAVSPPPPTETPQTEQGYTPIRFENQTASASDRARCESVGGVVRRVGLAGFEACVQDLPDAGQSCAGESDCLGRCVLVGSDHHLEFDDKVDGVCEATDSPFGCVPLVENDGYAGTLCVD